MGARVKVVQQNDAFIRQGEWLFVPVPGLFVEEKRILRHEPLRRRGVEAHVVEELFRTGGEAVYFSASKRRVLTVPQFRKLLRERPAAVREDWRIRQREMAAYGRGTVVHPNHRALTLAGWHLILKDTETCDTARRSPRRGPAGSFFSPLRNIHIAVRRALRFSSLQS